ncbi:MAG: hypothetical protein LAO03_12490 [Acidobacteriia bacterium]|nr:hypothetical protein [Terriglobia bacterium]
MAKRQRFVYPTDEVPHLWAHKTQSEATNPRRNLYFTGDTIFSYGEHFPIARHVTGGTKRKPLAGVLFTSRSYSSTTAKHKGKVRQSIPSNVMAFEVPNVNVWDGHSANLQYFSNEAKRLLAKAQNGRKYGAYSWKEAQKNVANAKAYATFFRITFPTKLFKFMPKGALFTLCSMSLARGIWRAWHRGHSPQDS